MENNAWNLKHISGEAIQVGVRWQAKYSNWRESIHSTFLIYFLQCLLWFS